jgi:hypothetical protein
MAPRRGSTYYSPTYGGTTYSPRTYSPKTYRSKKYRSKKYRSKTYRSKTYRSKKYRSRAYNSKANWQRERERYLRKKYKTGYSSKQRYLKMTPEEIQQRRTAGLKLKQVDPETESLPTGVSPEANLEPLKTSIARDESEPEPLSVPKHSE